MRSFAPRALVTAAAAAAVGWAFAASGPAADPAPDPPPDQLAALGLAVTGGAAAGYVDSQICGMCHSAIAASYEEVGMSRSFARPRTAAVRGRLIEDFAAPPYFHAPSRRYYRIERRGDDLVFRRWQLDEAGQPIHRLDLAIEWILGSGHTSRVYLYRTPQGELYQLPLAWYSQEADGKGAWAMAPGFDRPDHDGVLRRVRRECMFCHNGYPDVAEGDDDWAAPHTFPAELPQGTGCQRCHGPGAEHVRRALAPGTAPETVRAAIVDPGELAPELRDAICQGCHLQPSVAIPGVRRFARGDYSFRPGERLDDFRAQMDVDEEGQERGARFEINHHAYRLEQSPCFRAGSLSCLSCHDPHRKVPVQERAAHYRAACLSCHGGIEHPAPAPSDGEAEQPFAVATADCAGCHMPRRRTQDVVHVVMTDHRITREPGPEAVRLAPLAEHDPVLTGLDFLRPAHAPSGALGEVYRAVGALRVGAGGEALDHLERNLARARPPEDEPWLELAQRQLQRQRFAAAEATLRAVLARSPGHPLAREWLAIAASGQGRNEEAVTILRGLLAEHAERPEPRFNLARLLIAAAAEVDDRELREEAAGHLRRVLELRPNQVAALDFLGAAELALGRPAEASAALRRALALDPSSTRSYLRLAEALVALGEREEARRYLRVGVREARDAEAVRQALAALAAEASSGEALGAR